MTIRNLNGVRVNVPEGVNVVKTRGEPDVLLYREVDIMPGKHGGFHVLVDVAGILTCDGTFPTLKAAMKHIDRNAW